MKEEKRWSILGKRVLKGKKGKKVGVELECSDGVKRTLLNPHGKGGKYAKELKDGVALDNRGNPVTDNNGEVKKLRNTQKAWRGGFLAALKANAKAYNAKKKKGGKKE